MPETDATPRDPAAPSRPETWRTEPVSFTRRGGRLTERLQRAWDDLAPTHVLDLPRSGPSTSVDPDFRLDVEQVFGRRAPLIVEIGSGRGEAIAHAAAQHPEYDFLGIEVYVPGVAQTLVSVRNAGATNVRLAIVNAAEALATMIDAGSVHEVWTFFPDPWHKKRHNKRRLITVDFAASVARVLEPEGTWRIATDWADYAEQIEEVLATAPTMRGGPVDRFEGRALTRFETKGLSVDRTIHDFSATPTGAS